MPSTSLQRCEEAAHVKPAPDRLTHSDGDVPKARKQYTVSKPRERWTAAEHAAFLDALKKYGRSWRKIESYIGSKSSVQVRSHAQKFFSKLEKERAAAGPEQLTCLDTPVEHSTHIALQRKCVSSIEAVHRFSPDAFNPPSRLKKTPTNILESETDHPHSAPLAESDNMHSFILPQRLEQHTKQLLGASALPELVAAVTSSAAVAANTAAAAVIAAAQQLHAHSQADRHAEAEQSKPCLGHDWPNAARSAAAAASHWEIARLYGTLPSRPEDSTSAPVYRPLAVRPSSNNLLQRPACEPEEATPSSSDGICSLDERECEDREAQGGSATSTEQGSLEETLVDRKQQQPNSVAAPVGRSGQTTRDREVDAAADTYMASEHDIRFLSRPEMGTLNSMGEGLPAEPHSWSAAQGLLMRVGPRLKELQQLALAASGLVATQRCSPSPLQPAQQIQRSGMPVASQTTKGGPEYGSVAAQSPSGSIARVGSTPEWVESPRQAKQQKTFHSVGNHNMMMTSGSRSIASPPQNSQHVQPPKGFQPYVTARISHAAPDIQK